MLVATIRGHHRHHFRNDDVFHGDLEKIERLTSGFSSRQHYFWNVFAGQSVAHQVGAGAIYLVNEFQIVNRCFTRSTA